MYTLVKSLSAFRQVLGKYCRMRTACTLSDFAKQNCIEGFLFLIFSYSLFGQPPLEELRPLFEDAQCGNMIAQAWCHAIVAVHTSELKNRLLYDHNTPEQSLLKKLFHVNVGGEFMPTLHEPLCYLTNNSIELLMSHLENYSGSTSEVSTQEAQALSKTLNTTNTKKNLIKNKPLKELIDAIRTIPDWLSTTKALLGCAYLKAHILSDFYKARRTSFCYDDFQHYQEWARTIVKKDVLSVQAITDFLLNNTPLIWYAQLKAREHVPGLPPKLYYAKAAPYCDIPSVGDCCETIVQEILNRLLYNPKTQQFDLSRVPSSWTLHPDCGAFYQKFNSAKTIQEVNDPDRRAAWMQLVSNIAGAKYRRNKNGIAYEVHPSVKNFNHIFTHLIGISPLLANNSIGQLRLKNLPSYDTHADIQFGFSFSLTQEYIFTVHIRKDHAWITDDNQTVSIAQTTSSNSNTCTYEQELVKHISGSKNILLRQLFGFSLPVHAISDKEEQKQLLFSHQTETDNQKYTLLRKLLACVQPNTAHISSAGNIIRDMYHTDCIKSALMRCIEKKVHSNQEIKRLILEKISLLDQFQKQQLLLCMAQNALHKDRIYAISMADLITELPDYEKSDDEKLIIDTKVYSLACLLGSNCATDDTIMDALEAQVMQLDFARFVKLQGVVEKRFYTKVYLSNGLVTGPFVPMERVARVEGYELF